MKKSILLLISLLIVVGGILVFNYSNKSSTDSGFINLARLYNDVADNFSNLVNPASQVSLPLVSTNDTTPRIAYWWGKVNQHVDSAGFWRSDPDGTQGLWGAQVDQLTYCRRWYPNTISIRDYQIETITNWKRAAQYEQSDYIRVTTSVECVQSDTQPVSNPPTNPPVEVTPIQNVPAISLTASPNPSPYNGVTNLSWNVSDATNCVASNGWTGTKNSNGGYQSIGSMTANTTFVLTCTGPGGNSTASVYVPVEQQVQVQNPPLISLTASPNPSPYNGVTNLSWNVSDATNCVASNGWTGTKNSNGGYQSIGNMNANTTFVLTCTGPGGNSTASVYVPVASQPAPPVQQQNPPIVTISASPTQATYGSVVNLTWNVSDATSCVASNGWTGTKNSNGGYQSIGNMNANTTFVLTCTGPGGNSTASVYVPVTQPVSNPPVIFLNASPTPVPYGGVVTLNWNVTNATSCVASNGWTGEKTPNGGNQTIGNMTAGTTFILTCTGPSGTSSNSVYVPIQQQVQVQNPPINNNNVTLVTSPVDNTQRACPVFTKYLKKGDIKNDPQEVILWQAFLNKYEGFNLVLDGLYGGKTEIAIRAFQTKYKQYVLIPWGITEATGYTYKTTRAYANFLLGCPEGSILLENGNVINFR